MFLAVLNGLLPIVSGAIELPPVLSSHMVLQRDRTVPIWGTGDANERITVEFAGRCLSSGQATHVRAPDLRHWHEETYEQHDGRR